MQESLVFVVITLLLAFVSRASMRKPGSHGFYRFFAWEFMLALFVLNLHAWHNGTEPVYIYISALLFFSSLLLVLFGIGLLHLSGKPDSQRDDVPLLEFEKTTLLVTTGIYGYIRHPIYGSLLLLDWGIFFKLPSLAGFLLALIASGLLAVAARAEESENIRYFGEAYREYMKRTRMFVPFIL